MTSLADIPGRAEKLRSLIRYKIRKPMLYRTDLELHSRRVSWIADSLAAPATERFPKYNPELARLLALVHDDLEMVIGDIQAGNKVLMNQTQIAAVEHQENTAIAQLAKQHPVEIAGYPYADLLWTAHREDTPEAWVVQFADKFDALGEACHEIFAGNRQFTQTLEGPYGTISTPPDHYFQYFAHFLQRFPALEGVVEIPQPFDYRAVVAKGRPHTSQSIKQKTGYAPYDVWIRLTRENGTATDIDRLTTPRETAVP